MSKATVTLINCFKSDNEDDRKSEFLRRMAKAFIFLESNDDIYYTYEEEIEEKIEKAQ